MFSSLLEKQLRTTMEKLSLPQQLEVLNFAKSLAGTMPVGIPGKELLHLAGTISSEDAKLMLEAIEENWGQAELNKWQIST